MPISYMVLAFLSFSQFMSRTVRPAEIPSICVCTAPATPTVHKPEPNPMEQRMAELEMALKEAEVKDKLASQEERLANAIERRASAQKKLSEAGKADLDAIEQETGTAHLRDMEKQQAQAEGNIALETVKQSFNQKDNSVANS